MPGFQVNDFISRPHRHGFCQPFFAIRRSHGLLGSILGSLLGGLLHSCVKLQLGEADFLA
jgi:hypothetical protein